MSGCPVHIWAPMMAAALPMSRAVRDRVRIALTRRGSPSTSVAPREVRRWAPITPADSHREPPPQRP